MAVTNPYISVVSGCRFSFSTTANGLTLSSGRQSAFQTTNYTPLVGSAGVIEVDYTLAGLTLAGLANTTLDLTTAFPAALTGIKYVAFLITSAIGQLQVGGTVANGNQLWFADASDGWIIYPGGPQFSQGHPSTYRTVDATHKIIYLANAHATETVTYRVIVGGKIT